MVVGGLGCVIGGGLMISGLGCVIGSGLVVGGLRGVVGSGLGGVVRSGFGSVIRSGLGGVAVGLLMVLGGVILADLALVLDVGVILLVLVNVVVDDLRAAVGQLNAVLAYLKMLFKVKTTFRNRLTWNLLNLITLTLDFVAVPLLVLGVDIGVAVLVVLVHLVAVSEVMLKNQAGSRQK